MLPFGDRIGRKATGGLYGYLVLKEWQKGRHLPFAAIVNNEKERRKKWEDLGMDKLLHYHEW